MKTPTPPKTPPKVERAEAKADKSVANLEGLTERLGTALEGILRIPARSRSEYLEKVQSALSGLFARLGGATEKMVDSLSRTLEAAAAKSDGSALALTTTYAEMRSTLKFAESDTMERVRHAVESFGGKPVAMETVRDKVMEELEPENGPQVRYANGARMSLKAYATMAARTARTETANMTALAQARETGTDYVYVPATTQGCELCISRSGRVYCISGKDSRFPPLTDLFPGSYKTIHPNCRCPLVPWYPEQYTPEEMRQAVQESNRSAKVKQDSPALARYKKQQEYNRQIIAEQRDFEAARQKYGAAMPYQSIASYRRAVRDFRKKHGTTKGFWEEKGMLAEKISPKVLTPPPGFVRITDTEENLTNEQVEYIPVKPLEKPLTEKEIIGRLSGYDETGASCSSIALAYCGNKNGLDVLDYRGGKSKDIFASRETVREIATLPGVLSKTVVEYNDFDAVDTLLKSVSPGKEYYLCAGGHAAIIRQGKHGFEYLELQEKKKRKNGFQKLDQNALERRFDCKKTYHGKKVSSILIDCRSLNGNKDFEKLLGYLNTNR